MTDADRQGGATAPDRARELAFADALVSIGRALTLLGARLADLHAEDTGDRAAATFEQSMVRADAPRGGLGPRQLEVLALGGFDSPVGLSAADVETATGLQRPNVHKLLQRLTELGHLEQLPDERPARWRRLRSSSS
ncbi:MarR family transcriptional regulator [Modestobacter sp. VKM Ac-2978]|uniref:MarR family transcriptional regulator n=1 Tax=Modestobacter sp. VKM Ac-2978 TaxID=3004132 RepID=UPI0022AB2748|nr:MarR family transcriptional regulator [Modestobacter sp. VKM Ac-2978]MCZ2849024.1 helix-turn-helix domain-containing protein [Modestobacter sp. VKM Ac-2978]